MLIDLSIVIPALAEAPYIAHTLMAVRNYLDSRARLDTSEVIVVTAEAADGTSEIARRELTKFPHACHIEPGRKVGKGRDVRLGMLAARGSTVLFMDADLATPTDHIDEALDAIAAGADVAIGVRNLAQIHDDVPRLLSSVLPNLAIRALLVPGISDTQCGFKAFRGAVVRELFEPLLTFGWGFDFEILARVRRAGHTIATIPIPDWRDPKGEHGLAGEKQWLARLRTLRELVLVTVQLGRQPASREARNRRTSQQAQTAIHTASGTKE
jgi:glycosyltransferase involved in cell wall biosynthesis